MRGHQEVTAKRAPDDKQRSAVARQIRDEWKRDRLDPDNYFVIPDFDAVPRPPRFAGFRDPIVTPQSLDRQLDEDLRELVKVGRALAKRAFKSLGEAREKQEEAYVWLAEGKPLTELHYAAFQYSSLESLGGIRLLPRDQFVRVMMTSAVLLAKWAAYGAVDRKMLDSTRKALEGARKGVAVRARKSGALHAKIVSAAREHGWPQTRGIPKLLTERFELSERQISSILKRAREEIRK